MQQMSLQTQHILDQNFLDFYLHVGATEHWLKKNKPPQRQFLFLNCVSEHNYLYVAWVFSSLFVHTLLANKHSSSS